MDLIQPLRPLHWPDLIYDIQKVLASATDVYLVGGTVRDAYRNYPCKDIDMACAGDGQPVARRIANALNGDYYPLDRERGVGRAIVPYQEGLLRVDVAALRGNDILTDLQDRDFTVNAMAVPLDSDLGGIYDPLGGIQDWQARILRRCSPDSIANDPIRALRAVRHSVALGLFIEPATRQDLRQYGPQMANTSVERLRDEFFALLDGKKPQAGLSALHMLGLLKVVIPEVENTSHDMWRFAMTAIEKLNILLTVISPTRDDNIAANAEFGTYVYLLDRYRGWLQTHLGQILVEERSYRTLLIFAALSRYIFNDAADAASQARALSLSNKEIKALRGVVAFADYPAQLYEQAALDPRTVYHYWRESHDGGIDACLLAIADYLAAQGIYLEMPAWTAFLQTVGQLFEGYAAAMTLVPLLSGDDLMQEFDLEPGPMIGQLLDALHEAQALGEITDREEAIAFAESLLEALS